MHTARVCFPINLPRTKSKRCHIYISVDYWFHCSATVVYISDVLEEPQMCLLVYSNFVKRLNSRSTRLR